jgi:N6-adenosine-specific RNA methylase IME4
MVVSFWPDETLEDSMRIGELRAAFADSWERKTGEPFSAPVFNAAFEPPVPIGLVIQFNKLALARDIPEMKVILAELLHYVIRHLQARAPWRQRALFESEQRPEPVAKRELIAGETVSSLAELVEKGRKFPTIYADPPWPYENEASRAAAVNHYPTMSLRDIEAEPVRELAAENAHLHLWTTNGFLSEALELVGKWGFEFKSCLVWVKGDLGMGNYWRVSHEYLLLGVRGSLTFRDRTLPSWVQAERTVHSRKPGIVRALVERVSPGPYLELYGREELPNSAWTVYGNQVALRHW